MTCLGAAGDNSSGVGGPVVLGLCRRGREKVVVVTKCLWLCLALAGAAAPQRQNVGAVRGTELYGAGGFAHAVAHLVSTSSPCCRV